jgi:hypothetical protein
MQKFPKVFNNFVPRLSSLVPHFLQARPDLLPGGLDIMIKTDRKTH